MPLLGIDIVGFWLGIFLTFCILSFLYKDNPFYKFAEHLFIGISIGYVVIQQYYNVLRPKMIDGIADADHWYFNVWLIALLMVVLMFVKSVSRRWGWLGRYPLAFVVAFYAGLQINGVVQADLGIQIKRATSSVHLEKLDINTADEEALRTLPGFSPATARAVIARRATSPFESLDELESLPLAEGPLAEIAEARGSIQGLDAKAATIGGKTDWFGTLSQILMLLGMLASLIYFYFSMAHKGVVGHISKFGVWILMIGFGASFGYTVQGRISLAIGRALDVLGRDKDPSDAAQIHGPVVALVSMAIIIGGLVVWEARIRKNRDGGSSPTSPGESGQPQTAATDQKD